MGALLSGLLYAALAGLLLALAHLYRRRPRPTTALVLILLPLAFTGAGWLPGKVMAPTASLATVPPWTHPDLVTAMTAGGDPPHPLLLDPLSQMLPWRQAAGQHWGFNPSQDAGAALLGNAQSAVLFPLEMVARQLPPVRAVAFSQSARLLVAVFGLFLLARAVGARETAALMGAVAYGGAGFLHVWRLHPHSYVAALAPWILLATFALARRPGRRPAVSLALVGALGVAAGHPETLLHCVLLAGLVTLPTLLRRGRWRAIVGGAAAAGLAALLAAPALLPFLAQLEVSKEAALRATPIGASGTDVLSSHAVPRGEVMVRLTPNIDPYALGDPRHEPWRGPENLSELAGGALAPITWALALAALARRREQRRAAPWIILAALGLAVAVGVPGLADTAAAIPLLGTSLLKRLTLWWALGLSVAAALGLEALLRGRTNPALRQRGRARRWALMGLAVGAALPLLLQGLQPTVIAGGGNTGRLAVGLAALLCGVIAVTLTSSSRRAARGSLPNPTSATNPSSAAVVTLTLALLLPQVAAFGRYIPIAPAASFYPSTPSLDFLRADLRPGDRVVGLNSALTPHAAAFFGLEDVRGYDPMTLASYARFVEAFAEPRRHRWPNVTTWSHPALTYLGVRYVLDHPTMYVFHHPGVLKVYEGEDGLIYENPAPLPRIFLPQQIEVLANAEDTLHHALTNPDFRNTAAAAPPPPTLWNSVEEWFAPGVHSSPRQPEESHRASRSRHTNTPLLPPPGLYPNGRGTIENLVVEPGRISASIRAETLTMVVTSQPALPGWRLFVDGAPAPLQRVNGAFLGALLTAGEHRIELRYRIPGWKLGWSTFALGLVLFLFGFGLRPRPPRPSFRDRRGTPISTEIPPSTDTPQP